MPAKREIPSQADPRDDAGSARCKAAPSSYYSLPLDAQNAWVNFLKAYKVVVDSVDRAMLADSPITLAEYELLVYVELGGGRMRFIDLSRLTLLSQSQISRRIASLQAKGYLYRESTNTDRRATYAVMTPDGNNALQASQLPFVQSFEKNFLRLIAPEDLAVFSRVLEALVQDPNYGRTAAEILDQANTANTPG